MVEIRENGDSSRRSCNSAPCDCLLSNLLKLKPKREREERERERVREQEREREVVLQREGLPRRCCACCATGYAVLAGMGYGLTANYIERPHTGYIGFGRWPLAFVWR
jgi:hypothetical protein